MHRLTERARKTCSKRRLEGWDRYCDTNGALPRLAGLASAVVNAPPALAESIEAAAARVREGRFAALGAEWPRIGADGLAYSDAWRFDPVTRTEWPGYDRYCFDIEYRRAAGAGDVKYIWEFNRLQFLQPLAAHFARTRDPRDLELIEAILESWVAANPPFRGLAWSELLNVAIRAISLLIVASLCGDALSSKAKRTIAMAIEAHRFWLHRFPSLHSSANNHLVAELAALFLIEVACGRGVSIEAERCWGQLAAETKKQFHPDGMSAEQSLTYGAFSAEFLLLAYFAGRESGRALPPEAERLVSFAYHVATFSMPDARLPEIGDNDEGRVVTMCLPEPDYGVAIAENLASFLAFGGENVAGDRLRDALFGRCRIAIADGVHHFPDGGATVVRERISGRAAVLTFDHGPLGYLSIAAHGHADALSLTLSLDGRAVLVDPGTYLYHSGREWRDWFRGTRAHNTLNICGVNQSIIAGPFMWSHKARARFEGGEMAPGAWQLAASHDGYTRRFGVTHRREIVRLGDGLSVRDTLHGEGAQREAEIVFQLAPELKPTVNGREVRIRSGAEPLASLLLPEQGIVCVTRGGDLDGGMPVGWVSTAFGSKQPGARVSWRGQVGERPVETRILIDEAGARGG